MPTAPIAVACPINISSLLASCIALSSPGGVQPFHYFARKQDLTITRDATSGIITAIAVKTGGQFAKAQGRKFQNSGTYESTKSPTGKSRWKHGFNDRIYHDTQADRNTLEQLALVEDLVIISPDNTNKYEVYGSELGLSPTSAKGGTGTKLDDDNTILFAFEGDETRIPAIFNTVTTATNREADFATNTAYLDNLVNV